MRSIYIASSILTLCLLASASFAHEHEGEDAAIQSVIDSAYVQGIHNEQDPEKIRAGFHESFTMFIQSDEEVRKVTRDEWVGRIEEANAKKKAEGKQGEGPKEKTTADITVLDHIGNAALAKVDVYRGGKQIFTDYMSLYKFEDGWKLVGKTFHRHP